jgi:hypothetical protein
MPTSLSGQGSQLNRGSGLSLAQRLYASSAKMESIPPLISASTRDLRNLDVPQAPPSRTSMSGIPTPPASVSPSAGLRSPPSLQNIPRENDVTHIPTNFADRRTNQSNGSVADTPVPSDLEIAPPSYALTDDEFSIPDQTNDNQEAPTVQPPPFDAAQSYEVPPPPLPEDNHHRSMNNGFYDTNPANDSPASQPPHFYRAQSYQVPPPPPFSGDRTMSYPASSSAHPSSSTGPRSTPQFSTFPRQTGNALDSTAYHQTTVSQPLPFQSVPATGNQPTGQPQTRGGSAVGKSILSGNVVDALLKILSGSNSGVNQSTLHAVLQGQPGADYQSIINALTLKQQQANMLRFQGSQQTPPIDYQALINELRRVQMDASPQQAATQQAFAHLAQQASTPQGFTQQAFARLAQQTFAHEASTQQAFAHLAQQASGYNPTQQAFAHLAQQASGPSATQQAFAHLAQQAAPQQPFAQQPFAQPPPVQQFAAQQTAAQQVAALEEQMAALQAYHRLAARGRTNALDLLDDGRYTYVRGPSNPRNRNLDLI